MLKIETIISRIKYIEEIVTDTQVAEILKVTPYTLSMWKKRQSIPYQILVDYCKNKKLSIDWLLTDEVKSQPQQVNELPTPYNDPKDEVIMRLEAENKRLRKICNFIDDIMTTEYKGTPGESRRQKKHPNKD